MSLANDLGAWECLEAAHRLRPPFEMLTVALDTMLKELAGDMFDLRQPGSKRGWTPLHRSVDERVLAPWLPDDVIAGVVRWYIHERLSYRDVVEWLAERGLIVDRSTVYRWVQRFRLARSIDTNLLLVVFRFKSTRVLPAYTSRASMPQ